MGKIFKALEKAHLNSEIPGNTAETIDEASPAAQSGDNIHISENEIAGIPGVSPMLVTGLNPQSIEAEQFRLLKNNILFPEKGQPPRSIMVTSTAPGVGKSFIAANLAISIAQNIDEYVFLMDCDLRSPSIHSLFGFHDVQGLSDYLSKAIPLSPLLVKSFLDKLTILPAGKIPFNPTELLSSEQMRRLLHEVRLRYADRYIIIDTPPAYLTSETNVISRQVDGIIIVVQQGKTRKKDVLDLVGVLGKDKILGVVYNFAKKKIGQGYGKYGYGKYGYGVKNA